MNTRDPKTSPDRNRKIWLAAALIGGTAALGGLLWKANQTAAAQLPDLLGKTQPALPAGALQVQDLQADPRGYTGSIVVRGVVAMVSPYDPLLFALIDSREARVCKDLQCAKFYLPVKVNASNLNPWDEVNVRGTMTEAPDKRKPYLLADEVENLGSIKK